MTRIGLISDTHLYPTAAGLPDEVFAAFAEVDRILHAGDLNCDDVITVLEALAPVQAVVGNTDPWGLCDRLPERLSLRVEAVTIGLTHGHEGVGRTTPQRAASWFPDADVVVFGHSHEPYHEQVASQLLLNPGSACDPRRAPRRSCGILTVDGVTAEFELIEW